VGTDTDTDMDMDTDIYTDMGLSAVIRTAPYVLPMTDYVAISNGTIYLTCPFLMKTITGRFSKFLPQLELFSKRCVTKISRAIGYYLLM
jgi:hypothetical protein